jgi:hypothetical protein
MELTIKLNLTESRRKKAHKKYLELAIASTHGNIVTHLLNGDIKLAKIKSKLFLKYNRRLKYLGL